MGQGFAKVRLTTSISKTPGTNFKKNEKFVCFRAFLKLEQFENFFVNNSHKTSIKAKNRLVSGN
jgi:hypothetical protein